MRDRRRRSCDARFGYTSNGLIHSMVIPGVCTTLGYNDAMVVSSLFCWLCIMIGENHFLSGWIVIVVPFSIATLEGFIRMRKRLSYGISNVELILCASWLVMSVFSEAAFAAYGLARDTRYP